VAYNGLRSDRTRIFWGTILKIQGKTIFKVSIIADDTYDSSRREATVTVVLHRDRTKQTPTSSGMSLDVFALETVLELSSVIVF